MTAELIHSLLLIATIIAAVIVSKTTLAEYDLQIAAMLFIVLFAARKLRVSSSSNRLIESVVFTFLVLFVVNSTGGSASPYFFLLYFLLFSLSLLLEPVISITTTVALIIFFVLMLPPNQSLQTLLPIFSLALLTPFALFMGQEYTESQRLKIKSQNLETTLEQKQEDTFLFLSLMLKNNLKRISELTDDFMGDHHLQEIKKHVRNMEKLIDKFEKQES